MTSSRFLFPFFFKPDAPPYHDPKLSCISFILCCFSSLTTFPLRTIQIVPFSWFPKIVDYFLMQEASSLCKLASFKMLLENVNLHSKQPAMVEICISTKLYIVLHKQKWWSSCSMCLENCHEECHSWPTKKLLTGCRPHAQSVFKTVITLSLMLLLVLLYNIINELSCCMGNSFFLNIPRLTPWRGHSEFAVDFDTKITMQLEIFS